MTPPLYIDFETGEEREVETDADGPSNVGAPTPIDEFIDLARPTEWVVQGRIAARATTIFAGAAKKAKKTLLGLWMILCVARGKPWLGNATFARPVIFCWFEGGDAFLNASGFFLLGLV